MDEEQNKQLVKKLYQEVMNNRDFAKMDELVSENGTSNNPYPGASPTREGFKQGLQSFIQAFPDIKWVIEDLFCDKDKVAVRVVMTGTNSGLLFGMPATNKSIQVSAIEIYLIEGGKIMEHWGNVDELRLMQQLGLVPPSPTPA
jgi:steroid delta-isomerase-like uncharacterized protein